MIDKTIILEINLIVFSIINNYQLKKIEELNKVN